jgi:hypothetical protein
MRVSRNPHAGEPDAGAAAAGDHVLMQSSYGVVWRDGDRPVVAGKLEFLPRGVRLDGREGSHKIPYENVVSVHVGRSAAERLDGRPSVVLERRGSRPLTISTVSQANLVGEIASRLAELQLGARAPRRLLVVLPLKADAQHDVRALLDSGPPFDPEQLTGLDRHEVFLTPVEIVFLFESAAGVEGPMKLLARPEVWQAAAAWAPYLDGPPRIAEDVFSWTRTAELKNGHYLPTPGPGDSEGGDIF